MSISGGKVLWITYQDESTPGGVAELISELRVGLGHYSVVTNVANSKERSGLNVIHEDFDAIVIHNTATYFASFLRELLTDIRMSLPAVPVIIMKQDEHLEPYEFDKLFVEFDVSVVFSCVSGDYVARVYPLSLASGIVFRHMFTSYLTRSMISYRVDDVGSVLRLTYRGSIQPVELGRLGREKVLLPEMISSLNISSKWLLDLSSSWNRRLYGQAWTDFLRNSRVVLGSESGSNVFDLDGSLRQKTRDFEAQFGKLEWGRKELVDKFTSEILSDFENNVDYATFAPRHLETAALGRAQLLVNGGYDAVLTPGESVLHFRNDLSDFTSQLERFEDAGFANKMGLCAREEVLSQDRLRAKSLSDDLKTCVDSFIDRRIGGHYPASQELTLVLSPVLFDRDPRHEWWSKSMLRSGASVKRVQFDPAITAGSEGHFGAYSSVNDFTEAFEPVDTIGADLDDLRAESFQSKLNPENDAERLLGRLFDKSRERNEPDQKFLANLFLRQFFALLEYSKTNFPKVVIANDLQCAFAACVLWGNSSITIIYDAQEAFSEMYNFTEKPWTETEKKIWDEIETFALRTSSLVCTVSPGLKEFYLDKYGVDSLVLPNFVPIQGSLRDDLSKNKTGKPKFVFMGNAAPHRGLEELIACWPQNKDAGPLYLYIPNSDFKKTIQRFADARRGSGADISIFFPDAVPESKMIETLSEYDFGIIPYNYSYPYNHCSPNKLGQYMAAGLAMIVNDQPFVSEIVVKNNLGIVGSWNNPIDFANRIVRASAEPDTWTSWQKNSRFTHEEYANWETHFSQVPIFLKSKIRDNTWSGFEGPEHFLNLLRMDTAESARAARARVPLINKLRSSEFFQQVYLTLGRFPLVGPVVKKLNSLF